MLPTLCGEARGTEGVDYFRSKDKAPNVFDTCWFEKAKYRQLLPERKTMDDKLLTEWTHMTMGLRSHAFQDFGKS
ncbi:hypothetical protein RvVAT039_pl02890 (plasmid) [Agrobacterium vitis]|nr:hypothetical protein RvVAT039_pl02890 [Agrobacterium vitis]